jgi:hypothetical protein
MKKKILQVFSTSILALFLFFTFFRSGIASSKYQAYLKAQNIQNEWQSALNFAKKTLPQCGTLHSNPDGYCFLKVDDQYIHAVFPLLKVDRFGFDKPAYFRRKNAPGAHISVFYADEGVYPNEIGQTFHFQIQEIKTVHPRNKELIVITLQSVELERLRERYGVQKKLHGNDFHITIAKKSLEQIW